MLDQFVCYATGELDVINEEDPPHTSTVIINIDGGSHEN